METSNPAFSDTVFGDWAREDQRATAMTIQGTAGKTFILLAIVLATAAWSWSQVQSGANYLPLLAGGFIVGLVFAFITIFKPSIAMYTSPVYAVAQGVALGALSKLVDARFPGEGIPFNAIMLTSTTLVGMLAIYASRIIRVTQQLRIAIVAATGAILLTYLVTFMLGFFGVGGAMYIHQATPIGIGFSLLVVGVAAFNLLLDFDFIERMSDRQAPKSMEWYGAFGLMVTLVWLYISFLRLLQKFQSR